MEKHHIARPYVRPVRIKKTRGVELSLTRGRVVDDVIAQMEFEDGTSAQFAKSSNYSLSWKQLERKTKTRQEEKSENDILEERIQLIQQERAAIKEDLVNVRNRMRFTSLWKENAKGFAASDYAQSCE